MLHHFQIKEILPHRYPILLVDKVLEIEAGNKIIAEKNITGTEPCFRSIENDSYDIHSYYYPQSLIIESFGQTACILATKSKQLKFCQFDTLPLFGSLNTVTFEENALPGGGGIKSR